MTTQSAPATTASIQAFRDYYNPIIATNRAVSTSFTLQKKNFLGIYVAAKNVNVTLVPIHGSCLFGINLDPNHLQESTLFDYATVGVLWKDLEANGMDFAYWKAICNWCLSAGMLVKAHAPIYNLPRLYPRALASKNPSEIASWLPYLMTVANEIGPYVNYMDTVNEQIHYPLDNPNAAYKQVALQVPRVIQLVNEYGFFTEALFTAKYVQNFSTARFNGVPYGGVGIQAHTLDAASFNYTVLESTLDGFRNYGKPVHISEISIPSAGNYWNQALQAEHLEKMYLLFMSKPQVEAITYWMLADGDPVRPTGGLLGKSAWTVLQRLIAEWRKTYTALTDSSGKASFSSVWKGTYKVMVAGKQVGTLNTASPTTTFTC